MSHASHTRTPPSVSPLSGIRRRRRLRRLRPSVRVCRFRVHRFRVPALSHRSVSFDGTARKFDQNRGLSLTSRHATLRYDAGKEDARRSVYHVRVTVYICMPHLDHPIPYKQHYPPHTWFPPLPHFTAPDLCKPGPQYLTPAPCSCSLHTQRKFLSVVYRDGQCQRPSRLCPR